MRYFDEERQDVCDAFFESVEVENGTAEGLYKSVKGLFAKHKIPLENIVGFGSDNFSDKVDNAFSFNRTVKHRGTKHLLLFLQYILKNVNTLNLQF